MRDIATYRHLGIEPPELRLLINRVHPVSSNARLIQQALRDLFHAEPGIAVLDTSIPAIEAYPRASTMALPVHRVEYRRPTGRATPAAFDTMRALARELLPEWESAFTRLEAGAHRRVST
jgi:chromosome partitioning related protein ParA